MPPTSSRSPRAARLWAAVPATAAGIGAVGIVVGMFLPWLRSGAVLRDSFQVIGVVRTVGFLRGQALEPLLNAWFAVIPAITLSVVAYAVGFRRVSATIMLVPAIITGTISLGASVESGGGETSLGIAGTGPTTTVTGAVLALLGAVGILAGERVNRSRIAGGEP